MEDTSKLEYALGKHTYYIGQFVLALAKIEAMKAENYMAIQRGETPPYGEIQFDDQMEKYDIDGNADISAFTYYINRKERNYLLIILKEAKSDNSTASMSSSFLRSFRNSFSNSEVSAVLVFIKDETSSFESRICSNDPNSCISAIAFSKS